MTAITITMTASATFALAYGIDATVAAYRYHRRQRRKDTA